jgi:hypothetical protein
MSTFGFGRDVLFGRLNASGRFQVLVYTTISTCYAVNIVETILCACSANEASNALIQIKYRTTYVVILVATFYAVGLIASGLLQSPCPHLYIVVML